MSKPIIVVESPAKAKTIQHYLNNQFEVVATLGHLIDLPKNKLGVDLKTYTPEYVPIKGKQKTIRSLKKKLKQAPKVYLAADPDREVESIAWQVVQLANLKDKDYDRIVFYEITPKAIKESFKAARKVDPYLVEAQQTRRILDRLIGYPLSQLLWQKVRYGLSAGRVQSAALRLIVEKEEQIRAFKPEKYAIFKSKEEPHFYFYNAKSLKIAKIKKPEDIKALEKAFSVLDSYTLSIENEYTETLNPPPPFDTALLQQEANRKLGFSAKTTMQIAQQLYQGVDIPGIGRKGLITYMRTDSYRLSPYAIKQIRSILKKLDPALLNPTVRQYKTKSKVSQEAHEAIRPTDFRITPESLKGKIAPPLLKLYSLIYYRALATQAKPAKILHKWYRATPSDSKKQNLLQRKELRILSHIELRIEPGFTALYGYKAQNHAQDPLHNKKQISLVFEKIEKQSKPPARYTDATLVKTLKKLGIGRPSTYANIISILPKRNYVEYEGKYIKPTDLGELILNFLRKYFPMVIDYQLTAQIEDMLDQIANKKTNKNHVINQIFPQFYETLQQVDKTVKKQDLVVLEKTNEKCPICGADMVVKIGKHGKFLSCSRFPECKGMKPLIDTSKYLIPPEAQKGEYTLRAGPYGMFWAHKDYPKVKKTMPLLLKETCPKCGSPLVERRTKKGRRFIGCSGYPNCDFIKSL